MHVDGGRKADIFGTRTKCEYFIRDRPIIM